MRSIKRIFRRPIYSDFAGRNFDTFKEWLIQAEDRQIELGRILQELALGAALADPTEAID